LAIDYSYKNGNLTLAVQVVPRASRSEVLGEHNGALRVRVAAPPVEGAANNELIATLAKALGVPRRNIEIESGVTGKRKRVSIRGATPDVLKDLKLATDS
jgi:uncharacterized protein